MFELYGVPKLLYSIDSMMSLYYNHRPQFSNPYTADGLVISFNTASTSVIPVLAGRGILNQSKRSAEFSFTITDADMLKGYPGEHHRRQSTSRSLCNSNMHLSLRSLRCHNAL